MCRCLRLFFFFNDTATTEIYTLSLHDALPIFIILDDGPALRPGRPGSNAALFVIAVGGRKGPKCRAAPRSDRKSTRLNSSHANISYAVFCLKKKNNTVVVNNFDEFTSLLHINV